MRSSEVHFVEGYLVVGWVKKAHHLKGEVFVQLFSKERLWIDGLTEVLLTHDKKSQSYKVTQLRIHKEGLILALKGLNNRNQSEALKGYQVSVAKDNMPSLKEDEFYQYEVLDFELFNGDEKLLGKVIEFKQSGSQDFLVIQKEENSFLVPFVDDLIVNIDTESKKIIMNLPEGLEDL